MAGSNSQFLFLSKTPSFSSVISNFLPFFPVDSYDRTCLLNKLNELLISCVPAKCLHDIYDSGQMKANKNHNNLSDLSTFGRFLCKVYENSPPKKQKNMNLVFKVLSLKRYLYFFSIIHFHITSYQRF